MKILYFILLGLLSTFAFAADNSCSVKMENCTKIKETKLRDSCFSKLPLKCIFPLYEVCEKELSEGGKCVHLFKSKNKIAESSVDSLLECLQDSKKASKKCSESAKVMAESVASKECKLCDLDFSPDGWEDTYTCLEKNPECKIPESK